MRRHRRHKVTFLSSIAEAFAVPILKKIEDHTAATNQFSKLVAGFIFLIGFVLVAFVIVRASMFIYSLINFDHFIVQFIWYACIGCWLCFIIINRIVSFINLLKNIK